MDLGLQLADRDGVAVLVISGEVDIATVPRFREQLYGLVADGRSRIIVDLSGVAFLDSAGIAVLIGARRRLRATADGELRLACPATPVRRLLEATGLTAIFDIFDTVDDALSAPRAGPVGEGALWSHVDRNLG